jgi:hypothetical protein
MSMVENLWGIETLDQISRPDVPKRILAEQASLLQKITNGLLYAEVGVTSKNKIISLLHDPLSEDSFYEFNYNFNICAPALGDFHYSTFSVHHDVGLYPCIVVDGDRDIRCASEADLRAAVHAILTSDRVQRIVASLVAQSAA